MLNGAAFGRDVIDFNYNQDGATNTGHFMVAIDIARFVPLATFVAETDRHLADLRASRRLPGVDRIRLPGDRRRACRSTSAAYGRAASTRARASRSRKPPPRPRWSTGTTAWGTWW